MNLKDVKIKVLGMIEELNSESEWLTDDPDIQAKINDVINQVQFELARLKKLPDYVEMTVEEGSILAFKDITEQTGNEVYQLDVVRGVEYEFKAHGTMIKVLESGTLEVEYYKYPKVITGETEDTYEFQLSQDVLEIMPYGVAADLLKSDVSAEYGSIYAQRYENMIQRLDSRYSTGSVFIEGGADI